MKRLAMISVLALTFTACGADEGPDSGAFLACRQFNDSGRDYVAGVITFTEMRGKMKGIESNASISEEIGIASNARQMLIAATAGDRPEFEAAGLRFIDACAAVAG